MEIIEISTKKKTENILASQISLKQYFREFSSNFPQQFKNVKTFQLQGILRHAKYFLYLFYLSFLVKKRRESKLIGSQLKNSAFSYFF